MNVKLKILVSFIVCAVFIIGCDSVKNGTLEFVEADSEKGFHYPYFLFIPDDASQELKISLVVESNNSGFLDDDLKAHIEKAERTATIDYYMGNYVARKLNLPLLVPVFPRFESDSHLYTHSLDRDIVLKQDEHLKRIDLQLLKMVDDARKRLEELGYKTDDQFLMTGFSASGTFANRFSLIHPEKVKAVAAGGLNGLLMLPEKEMKGRKLIYPVGTYDFEALFGKSFNPEAFQSTPQFLFMGKMDDNDAIPYSDAFDEPERQIIYELLGKEMQPQRWEACQLIYDSLGIDATIKTYEGIGHEHPENIKDEVVDFFQRSFE
jgi:hypothetical protein